MKWKGSDNMDFTKLNLEFSNMQNMIGKYNDLLLEINNRIKINTREINKYESKIKNSKSILEKELYKVIILSYKNETSFLENMIKEEENENESKSIKNV